MKKKKRERKEKENQMNDKVREEGLLKLSVGRRERRWVLGILLPVSPHSLLLSRVEGGTASEPLLDKGLFMTVFHDAELTTLNSWQGRSGETQRNRSRWISGLCLLL